MNIKISGNHKYLNRTGNGRIIVALMLCLVLVLSGCSGKNSGPADNTGNGAGSVTGDTGNAGNGTEGNQQNSGSATDDAGNAGNVDVTGGNGNSTAAEKRNFFKNMLFI